MNDLYTLCESEKMNRHSIIRITPDGRHRMQDVLLKEESWMLYVNNTLVTRLNCFPFALEQLAVGHLYCCHMLRHRSHIDIIIVDNAAKHISAQLRDEPSPMPAAEEKLIFTTEEVHFLQDAFNGRCHLFRETGSAHSCALASHAGIEVYFEDIARHNSLDKVIGEMVLRDISPSGKAMIFSGRLSCDMMEKIVVSGVKVLIAPGAPSMAAVNLAERHRITLMGFVRPGNINIYTHPERIA